MIVVLVHKPETVVYQDPTAHFDGISVHGIYYETEHPGVLDMVANLMKEHPDWAFQVTSDHKLSVGFNVPQATKPAPKRRK